jgi:hypothetical protein
MQLKIEKWVVEQNLSKRVTPLFDEAIKSYKVSAYKASLLFSYLGFMTILKERIIKSQLPPGIPQGMWDQIKVDVQNKEAWDKKVFDSTQKRKPAVIFPISETIRREVVYWKDRRNDCAHFKHEKIDYHHVESFWSFLDTNLSKFTVNGGRSSLVRKLKNHFDLSITPPDQPLNPLINEVESAVEPVELQEFFKEVEIELDEFDEINKFIVFNAILEYYTNQIADDLVDFLKADDTRLLTFLRSHPNKIQYLDLSDEIIRELWYKRLFSESIDDFKVYAGLLQNNLIRNQDIPEANQRIVNRLGYHHKPDTYSKIILEQNGFYPILKERLFPKIGHHSYSTANICVYSGVSDPLVPVV